MNVLLEDREEHYEPLGKGMDYSYQEQQIHPGTEGLALNNEGIPPPDDLCLPPCLHLTPRNLFIIPLSVWFPGPQPPESIGSQVFLLLKETMPNLKGRSYIKIYL